MSKLADFYNAMIAVYPDIGVRGEFTSAQVKGLKQNRHVTIPGIVWQNKVSRGVFKIPDEYRIDSTTTVNPCDNATEFQTVKSSSSLPLPMTRQHATEAPSLKAFVPERDSGFVPFGSYKDVEGILSSRIFYPVYVTGLSGNGKSTMVEQICAKHKRPMIRVNLNALSDEDQLIGSKTLVDGNVEIVEGPVLIAMRSGSVLLCLEKSEKVRVGTVDNWSPIALADMKIEKDYPIVSYNMETSQFENDNGRIYTEHSRDDLYEVEFEDGSNLVLTSDHPFICEGNIEKSIIGGLRIGDVVVSMN